MFRRAALVACTAIAVGVTALTLPASAAPPSRVRVTGTYQLLVADGHGAHPKETYQDLLVAGTKTYRLKLGVGRPRPGQRITVSGSMSSGTLAADTIAPATAVTALATTAPARRMKSVLVILASWTAPDSVTRESAAAQVFGDGDAWHREVSYGAEGLTGDVTPWVSIAGPTDGLCFTNHRETMLQGKAAALLAGYDATAYERTILYFPRQTNANCSGYSGWAYQPGTEVWLNGTIDRRATMHELGHSGGLPHAASLLCTTTTGVPVVLAASGCRRNEYGDPTDAMGSSVYVGHFSSPQKNKLGWLPTAPADLSTGGSTVLAPYEAPGPGVAAAKVTTGTGRVYWFEYRTPYGADAGLPAGNVGGLLVHLVDPAIAVTPMLLDMVPDNNFTAAALPQGRSWTSPEGYVVTVGEATSAGLPLTVEKFATPGAVTGIAAVPDDRAVTVSWNAPASDGGTPITEYRITIQPGGATTSVGAAVNSATMSGLVNGTSYVLSVVAVNKVGSGVAVTTAAVVPADVVPPAPVKNLNAKVRHSRLTLQWVNPSDADFSGVDVRMVYGSTPPASADAGTLVYSGTGTSVTLQTLAIKGATYSYAVFPRDDEPNWGQGAWARMAGSKVSTGML